ncbi:hypothetical protein JANAI62_10820 [Jannaschia pagri]|uniref:Uncharacterized protein n=1 Tax=Jannaschia pagri TaxID=2829797 RepID=A0ABQ4NJ73_9RHOB|nr:MULTISPECIES: hypothetical protein [unclassified Jannaschia]GIT90627.1 hypothetical protein JANAI61_10850 [Jannaschia sp. AI_61]GIT94459.1 hypothetical protein JANAI62_10820 [Jannaschia sp. AI_62]
MDRRYFLTFAAAATLTLAACNASNAPSGASADPRFAAFQGVWTGQQVRLNGSTRPMTITIAADGSYSWVSEGTKVTDGRLVYRGDQLGYVNDAGSQGTVTEIGETLAFSNTFTGDNYTVTVSR